MTRILHWLAFVGLIGLAGLSVATASRGQEPECKTFADYLIAVERDNAVTLLHETDRKAESFLFLLNSAAPMGAYVGPLDEVAVFYVLGDDRAYMIILTEDCIQAARRLPAALPMYVILLREDLIPDSGAAL